MCTSTRYPEAIPLRNMTTYHPESQGALEYFHGTLKSMLIKFCTECELEWNQSLPFLLYAIRNLNSDNSYNISEFVEHMHERVIRLRDFARENLEKAKKYMKETFDKKSKERQLQVGDEVLVIVPVKKSPLSVKFEGPVKITAKLSDLKICRQYLEDFTGLFGDIPSRTDLVTHDVKLVPGTQPVRQPPYRMSQDKLNILKSEIKFLFENDIIENSFSEWSSPVVLVPIPDSTWR
ncbi:uncharacterized protein LOC119582911 [Penaeus monodon]|uniref:uncharacterized protein LOC119582911 n=1 Tax=Penaeus monodon TaxID=6687 RepID=UPI0018A6D6AB|nr:uncharacterized protein LOC119582911 [Penaeus monodon]